jgi:hypothetical protein
MHGTVRSLGTQLEADYPIVRRHKIGEVISPGELRVHALEILFGDLTGPCARQSNVNRYLSFDELIEELTERREPHTLYLIDNIAQQHVHRLTHHHDRWLVAPLQGTHRSDEWHRRAGRIIRSERADI